MTKASKPTVTYGGQLYGFDTTARGGGQWRVIGTTGNYGKFLRKDVQDAWGKPLSSKALAEAHDVEMPVKPPKENTRISDKAQKQMKKQAKYGAKSDMRDLLSTLFGENVADIYSFFADDNKGDKKDVESGLNIKAGKAPNAGKTLTSDNFEKVESATQELHKETNKILRENNKILLDLVKFFKDQAAKADIKGDITQAATTPDEPLERLGAVPSDTEEENSNSGPGLLDFFNPFSRRMRARGKLMRKGAGRFLGKAAGFGKAILGGIGAAGAGIASKFSVPNMSTVEPIVTPKAPGAAAAAGEASGAAKSAGAATKGGLKSATKVLKGLGPIAAVLGIGATIYELTELKQQLDSAVQSGEMTEAEADKQFKKEAVKAIGNSLGAVGGGIAGAALGSIILPFVGTALGGIAGGIAGGFGGEYLAEKLYDFLDSGKEIDHVELEKKIENPKTGSPMIDRDMEELRKQSKQLRELSGKYGLDPNTASGRLEGGVITSLSDKSGKQIDVTPDLSPEDTNRVNGVRSLRAQMEGTQPKLIPEKRATGDVVNSASTDLVDATRSVTSGAAPIINNIVNNSGGGGTVSVPGPTSSSRNDDSAYRRAQDRLISSF